MPRILIQNESKQGETRVAATPESAKKFISIGFQVSIEKAAGQSAGFADSDYRNVGCEVEAPNDKGVWSKADLLLCVKSPQINQLSFLKPAALIVGLLEPYGNEQLSRALEQGKLSAIALELLPRISRAQSADALSSQANIAGYKSVLLAASALDRYFPMLMTAAGTVQPAKVVVLGAGVAGLQAIATAKRLGAVVYVSDIREGVKEQIESLGARFIPLPEVNESPKETGGYAKQVSEEFLKAQRKLLSDQLAEADVAICTAQVPGRKAPRLINESMLDRMRTGSVVVDLAVAQGGNCAETKAGETIVRNGVKLIGAAELACSVPNHASSLYSRNLLSLIQPLLKEKQLFLDIDDQLISGCLISYEGKLRCNQVLTVEGSN